MSLVGGYLITTITEEKIIVSTPETQTLGLFSAVIKQHLTIEKEGWMRGVRITIFPWSRLILLPLVHLLLQDEELWKTCPHSAHIRHTDQPLLNGLATSHTHQCCQSEKTEIVQKKRDH